MDELLKRQDLIQNKLAKKHLQEGCVVLYDITSSYFEGDHIDSELIDYGYNRDKKKGHKQIVIGFICAKDGCPVSVEVFKGNTNDSKTVSGKLSEISDKYGISNVVFVGDRGMLTKTNIKNHCNTSTITALTHSDIRKLCDKENVQLSMFDVDIPTEITFPEEPGVRYALRKKPERARKEKEARQAILTKIEEKLAEVATPKRKVTTETLGSRVGKIFAKYGNQKYFEWSVAGKTVTYTRKHNKIAEDEQYDDLYVIRTNVTPEEMSTIEFVEAYRKLINVEQAFRNLKTAQFRYSV
jgi:transposase